MASAMGPIEVDQMLRPLLLKDLRVQCRVRNLNPGGSQTALRERVRDHMLATGDFAIYPDTGGEGSPPHNQGGMRAPAYPSYPQQGSTGPPMGGDPYQAGYGSYPAQQGTPPYYSSSSSDPNNIGSADRTANNYMRPGGAQNVGNFITDRNTSRVLAPPGGRSQISFGDYSLPHQGKGGAGGTYSSAADLPGRRQQQPHSDYSPGPAHADSRYDPPGAPSYQPPYNPPKSDYAPPGSGGGMGVMGAQPSGTPPRHSGARPGGSQLNFGEYQLPHQYGAGGPPPPAAESNGVSSNRHYSGANSSLMFGDYHLPSQPPPAADPMQKNPSNRHYGGSSQVSFGDYQMPHQRQDGPAAPVHGKQQYNGAGASQVSFGDYSNPYSTSSGQVGQAGGSGSGPSYAPPGGPQMRRGEYASNGSSQISFGDYAGPTGAASRDVGSHMGVQGPPPPMGGMDMALPGQVSADSGYYAGVPGLSEKLFGGRSVPTTAKVPGYVDPGQSPGGGNYKTNNYSRPGGAQNVGNFITDRPSSKVLQPPGGRSQISFS